MQALIKGETQVDQASRDGSGAVRVRTPGLKPEFELRSQCSLQSVALSLRLMCSAEVPLRPQYTKDGQMARSSSARPRSGNMN